LYVGIVPACSLPPQGISAATLRDTKIESGFAEELESFSDGFL
jgi:hypothetical protein